MYTKSTLDFKLKKILIINNHSIAFLKINLNYDLIF